MIPTPQITNLLSFWNVSITLFIVVLSSLLVRQAVLKAARENAATWEGLAKSLREELDTEKVARRKVERRLSVIESEQEKWEMRHRFDQGEKELYQQIIRMAWKVIEPLANGSKGGIERKFEEVSTYQNAMRDAISEMEENQRLFRRFPDED